MKAAEAAALRGHHVTLLERDDELGGSLRLAAALPGRSEWNGLVSDLRRSIERRGVDVRLSTEVDPGGVLALHPDAVAVATGARFDHSGWSTFRPDRLTIPGADQPHVTDPAAAVANPDSIGARVVIVDEHGNHAAMSLARLLAEAGHTVELVTHGLFAGMAIAATMDIPFLLPALACAGVRLTPQSFVERIEPAAVVIADMWGAGERTEPADTVILNLGRLSDSAVYDGLRGRGLDVRRIGDARVPREVDDAIYEGERWGRTIAQLVPPATPSAPDRAAAALR
jgi:hypothetical protein